MKTNVAWAQPYQHVSLSDEDILARVRKFAPEHVTGKLVISYTYVTSLLGRNATLVWVYLSTNRIQRDGISTRTLEKIAESSGLTVKQAKCGLAILRKLGFVKSKGYKYKKDSGHTFYTVRKIYGCPGIKVLAGTGKCVIPISVATALTQRKAVKRGGRRPGAGRPTNEVRRRRLIESEVIANDNGTKQESNGTEQTTEIESNSGENYRNIVELYEFLEETSPTTELVEQSNGTDQSFKLAHQICSDLILSDQPARSEFFFQSPTNVGERKRSRRLRGGSLFSFNLGIGVFQATQSDPSPKGAARNAKGSTILGARETGARGTTIEDRKKLWPEKHPLIPADYYCYDLDDGRVRSFIRTILRGGSRSVLDAYVSGALDAK